MLKRALFIAMLFMFSAAVAAANDDGLDCLRGLKGGTVRWDLDWQRDRTDQDVRYRIVDITESNITKSLHEVAVELLAIGPAAVPKRVSRIRLDYAAEMFCKRAQAAGSVPPPFMAVHSLVQEAQKAPVVESFNPKQLPYRALVSGQWKVARAPADADLKVCVTKAGIFSCKASDQAHLVATSEAMDIAGRGKLPAPLLRFRDGGWVRGSEADMQRAANVVECDIFKRQFRCLEEEKNAYGALLKQIEERVEKHS